MPPVKPDSPVDYWRSLADRHGASQRGAPGAHGAENEASDFSRRRWLQLMGASLAMAGAASGCRWEKRELVPDAVRQDGRSPGVPRKYATALDIGGAAQPLLVTSVDGRPIKVEGNPRHPQSGGATDAFAQAAILQLYDPERGRTLLRSEGRSSTTETWDTLAAFLKEHVAALRQSGGAGFRVLAEAHSSPTLARLRQQLQKALPLSKWVEYEALSDDNVRGGAIEAFGKPYRTQLKLGHAQVIASLDADLWESHPAAVQYIREFTAQRSGSGSMPRLYAVEACLSLTGASADHRLPLASEQIGRFALQLEQAVRAALDGKGLADAAPGDDATAKFLRALAKDLAAGKAKSLVVAGARQPAAVQATVHRINALLGAVGQTLVYTADPAPERPLHAAALRELTADMQGGKVQTLLVVGGNPVYDAPVELNFAEALGKVGTRIRLAPYVDETALQCQWYLPQTHFLESWGDARSFDGTYTIAQPLIAPLLGGKSTIEVLALLLGETKSADKLVRETFSALAAGKADDALWNKTLHDGLLAESRFPTETPKLVKAAPPADKPAAAAAWDGKSLEVIFCASRSVYDGRYSNNGWLQELPDAITRLTWDNAALISPATADKLKLEDGAVVRLSLAGRVVLLPAYTVPGQAPGTVAVALGYGRTAAGAVGGLAAAGLPSVGVDVYKLRTIAARDFAAGATLEDTGGRHRLATTQLHHKIDKVGAEAREVRAKELARETTLVQLQSPAQSKTAHDKHAGGKHDDAEQPHGAHDAHSEHGGEHPPLKSLWEDHQYDGHRWGLSVDLSKCIGCNACTIACQAENNVPIVGKERVLRGREMHWMRIDRYYVGDEANPHVLHQPVMCQQCEMAPCEQVCPVAATVHTHEGLNDMVYNRCVGTRYCANNCPYKVRRFNYFNFHKSLEDPANELVKMAYNPEVTVRSRGVMEKCTYCVQRIQHAKIEAKNQRRPIADGEIKTACQQVCPAQAIVFGDLSDAQSGVAKAHGDPRAYGMLAEFNFRPRTAYLTRVRNPNPELEDERDRRAV